MIDRRHLLGAGAAMAFTPMGDRLPGGRRPDQHYDPPIAPLPAGGRQGLVRARLVIVSGSGEGVFVYNGIPAAGDLLASVTGSPGNDGTSGGGNRYGAPGFFSYANDGTNFYQAQYAAADLSAGGMAIMQVNYATTPSGIATSRGGVYVISNAGAAAQALITNSSVLAFDTAALLEVQGSVAFVNSHGSEAWVLPSGDATGATDYANINAALTASGAPCTVHLLAGQYHVNNTIVVPTGCGLIGAFPTQADNFSNYSAGIIQAQGTVITPVGAFTNAAVVACQNSTVGVQQGGQVLANFSIQANTTGAGSGSMCVLLDGAVGAGYMTGITAIRGDAACLRIRSDVTTSHIPDQWTIENCTFAGSRSGHGVLADDMSDFNMVNCYSHDNALDGYNIRGGGNANWTACRAETNTGNGFHFTGFPSAGETMTFHGCMTELNKLSGFLFDATGFTNQGQYVLSGCSARADGQAASGILAGFYDDGSKCPVLLSGCSAITNGTGPAYGAYEGSVAFGMALTGCRSQGLTAATHDDGTNTNVLSNLVTVPF